MAQIAKNVSAASALLGVSVDVVKFAKSKGCAAWKANGNIDVEVVRQWLSENAEALKNRADDYNLKDQKTIEEIRKLKLANDIKEGRYTLTTEAEAEIEAQARECRRVLYQIPDRLAPELAGLGPVEISARLNKAIDEAVLSIGGK